MEEVNKKRNSVPQNTSFPSNNILRKDNNRIKKNIFYPKKPIPLKTCFGMNFMSIPNINHFTGPNFSIQSNNLSLNAPNLSIYSDKNNLNFYEQFCKKQKQDSSYNYKCPNSEFDFDALNKNYNERIIKDKPIDQNSWKFTKLINSPNNKGAFFDEKVFNNKINFNKSNNSKIKKIKKRHSIGHPFFKHEMVKPNPIENNTSLLQKRESLNNFIHPQNKRIKIKRHSLILPKVRNNFHSEFSISESDPKNSNNQLRLNKIGSHIGMPQSNLNLCHSRNSHPNIKFNNSKCNDSTIPDISQNMRKAVEMMKEINILNTSIKCNDLFRMKINNLVNTFNQKSIS